MKARALWIASTFVGLSACAPAVNDGGAPPPQTPRTPQAAASSAAPRCLSIVAWNDLHGQLSADEPVVDTGRVPAGGVAALADEVEEVRRTGDAVVVLDAGDLFTGPLASTRAEGAPVIEAYKLIGVDAAAFGNHEFDFGPVGHERITAAAGVGDEAGAAGPRGALLARMEEAGFPFLSANLVRTGGAPTGWPHHKAFTRIQRAGFDVGVVGYTTKDTPTTTLPPNVVGLDFATGAASRVAAAVRELRATKSYPVVLLAHASIEGTLPQSLEDSRAHEGEIASLLAELGPDLPDLVVAGHRHAWMIGRVRGVPIVSSDQHGVGLARARFCQGNSGAPALESIERRTAIWSGVPRTELGAKVADVARAWEAKVKPIADERVTVIPKECAHRGPHGSELGDQVARATRNHVADAAPVPAGVPVVGFVNAGGLRAPLAAGPVRYGDLFTVFPFDNTVAACGTTRAGLVRFIENALKKDASRERFPLGIAGAKLKVRKAPDGTLSLASLTVDGEKKKPAPDDSPVWLAISDFLLFGGDALLAGIKCAPAATSQTRVREAWRATIERERACDGPSKSVTFE